MDPPRQIVQLVFTELTLKQDLVMNMNNKYWYIRCITFKELRIK